MSWNTATSYSGSIVPNTVFAGIGNDLRVWGGNVDAGGSNLANLGSLTASGDITTHVSLDIAYVRMRGWTIDGSTVEGGIAHDGNNIYLRANLGVSGISVTKTGLVKVESWPVYASDAAAKAGGLTEGMVYRDSSGNVKAVLP